MKVIESIKENKGNKENKENKDNKDNIIEYHEILGKISYKNKDDLVIITFLDIPGQQISIYINPIIFKNEKNENIYIAFNEYLLKKVINLLSRNYEFYVEGILKNSEDILKEKPPEILLKKKNSFNYEIFKSLNNKYNLSNQKIVSISTNEVIPDDIKTLGLQRNKEYLIVVNKRDELIAEIDDFFNSEDEILKIYGCDGIGKSISFIYLQTLIKDYKIIYFNLKEISNFSFSKQIDILKKQLMMYFTENTGNLSIKEKLNKYNYERYNNFIKDLDNDILNMDNKDFWGVFNLLIKKNVLINVLYIIDQYKEENDKKNYLDKIENIIIKHNTNSKLLVSYSINNGKTKNNFINILKELVINNPEKFKNYENKNKNDYNKKDKIEEFFDSYDPNKNYIDESLYDEHLFEKIKIFNEQYNQNLDKQNINNPKIIYPENKKIKKIYIRIIYINKLISIQNIQNNSNKDLIGKMEDFDYNPKYFFQFKEFYEANKSKVKIDELYKQFLINKYEHISFKIIHFYKIYFLKSQYNLYDSTAMKYLTILLDFIKNKKIFTLKELIINLEFFPLKYIRIYKIIDEDKITNIIRLNEDLNKFKFKLDFVFPFIEFVIRKLINEIGNNVNINYTGFNSDGVGSILQQQQILKEIMSENSLINCNHPNICRFQNTNNHKNKLNQKYDIFNFHEIKLDDIKKKLLDDYYSK